MQTQDFMQNAIGGVVTRASKDVQLHASHMLDLLAAIVWFLFAKLFVVCVVYPVYPVDAMHRAVIFSDFSCRPSTGLGQVGYGGATHLLLIRN